MFFYKFKNLCILHGQVFVMTIGNVTTDGDSNAFKGTRDAQIQMTGKPMERTNGRHNTSYKVYAEQDH